MGRRRKRSLDKKLTIITFLVVLLVFEIYTNFNKDVNKQVKKVVDHGNTISYDIASIPEYNNNPYVILNDNKATFTEEEKAITELESYSELDELKRCGTAFALVNLDTMPTKERESIGKVKPTGWHTVKYDIVDGKYLYNRCHLIGYQLTGENANNKNLITCTRYMNTVGMLEFENKVAYYIRETDNNVLYRVTPVFDGDNLLAKGVIMEAYSIEDKGKLEFNVFVFNVQPGINIDYQTGDSSLAK
ncbi:MAG: DNA/RNA non-specific endonuclease [Bacilli bacterium]|nr:DNA/RNA non-specific endonuclease [Bacilli bacterium]